MGTAGFSVDVVERGVSELAELLATGQTTSVELVNEYLRRIARYDRSTIRINSVPVLNPDAFAEARASDERRARGESRGPFDGIPFTVKDSYLTAGLPAAAGSPAFVGLIAQWDAFTVARLREAGAVLIGRTNMSPMANGGMHRGVYGRSESPYHPEYLAAGYVSGSSNGSGASTAASFAAFGLGEETWSSGRSPASNNGLCAYTPSRGVISIRGNWPLTPTMDVVVPHTRSMSDMRALLDVIVVEDPETRGDFWRHQSWVEIPRVVDIRPPSFAALDAPRALEGITIGVPRIYIGADTEAQPVTPIAADVRELWESARHVLEGAGAIVREVDFPAVENYEKLTPGARGMVERGLWHPEYLRAEVHDLTAWALDDFLRANDDPQFNTLSQADPDRLFPLATGTIPDSLEQYGSAYDLDLGEYVRLARAGARPPERIEHLADGVEGLIRACREDLEHWMAHEGLDALVFPAALDVGREDAERNPESYAHSWLPGIGVSTGGLVIRHFGMPTATVPMGHLPATGMPVGLTFAGAPYSDWRLLALAGAFEAAAAARRPPARTPALPAWQRAPEDLAPTGAPAPALDLTADIVGDRITVEIRTDAPRVSAWVAGMLVPLERTGDRWRGSAAVPEGTGTATQSEWREPYGAIVQAVAFGANRGAVGAYLAVGGIL